MAELEALADQALAMGGHIDLGVPAMAELLVLWNNELSGSGQMVTRIYWSVSDAELRGVAEKVRNRLVEMAAELRAGVADGTSLPRPEVADRAVSVVINGNDNRIGDITVVGPAEDAGRWFTSARFWAITAGVMAVATFVLAVLAL